MYKTTMIEEFVNLCGQATFVGNLVYGSKTRWILSSKQPEKSVIWHHIEAREEGQVRLKQYFSHSAT